MTRIPIILNLERVPNFNSTPHSEQLRVRYRVPYQYQPIFLRILSFDDKLRVNIGYRVSLHSFYGKDKEPRLERSQLPDLIF
jgi:hypothetical protein